MKERMLSYLRPYRFTLVIVLIFNVCSTLITTIQPMLGKIMIDDVLLSQKYPFPLALGAAASLMAIAYGLSLATKYLYMKTSLNLMLDMRTSFYDHLLHLPYSFFSQKRVGDVVSRVNEDLAETQRLYTDSFMQLVSIGLTCLLHVGLLFYLEWKTAFGCLALLPLLIWGTQKFRDLLYLGNLTLRELSAHNQSFLFDTLSSVRFIRTANLQSWLKHQYKEKLQKTNKQTIKVTFVSALAQGVPQAVLIFSTLGILLFLGLKVQAGSMSIGTLIAFTAYQTGLYSAIQGLANLYIRLQKGKAAVQRVNEFLNIPEECDGRETMIPFRRELRFEQVCFSHDGGSLILNNLDLSIQKGEKIGIVGESGIGKSTLADLLARLFQPSSGIITLDGVDIRHMKRSEWMQHVCLLAHDHPIWFGSLADYLRLGSRTVSEEQMQIALQEVGLWKDVEKMPDALQTQVGEKGVKLSAGQRQRLLLARALLQEPEILILDEATCHLDLEAERKIMELIQQRFMHKTVILITHRLPNIMWVDRLLRLKDGSIRDEKRKWGGDERGAPARLHG
ncbi:ABC transporter ATP-binding protein [Brevibacillus sp. NRS-1366]|uniref:ABC transporter ATP-binding protein n=1 Tax=Brevibacillus sp. NRS-1366 TaxID=3233899 RepID=UPI003D1F4F98